MMELLKYIAVRPTDRGEHQVQVAMEVISGTPIVPILGNVFRNGKCSSKQLAVRLIDLQAQCEQTEALHT